MTDEDLQRLKAISCFKQSEIKDDVFHLSFEHANGGRVVLIVKDFETELREGEDADKSNNRRNGESRKI